MTINTTPAPNCGFAAAGPPGPQGLWPEGEWAAGTKIKNTVLSHNNRVWVANKTTTQEPSDSASDWDLWIDAQGAELASGYAEAADVASIAAASAKSAAEAARDSAIAAERRMRTQSLGTFANDAAAVAWAAAQTPPITIVTGTSYLNSTTDVFRYAVVSAGPTITWHDVTEDEAAQAALATASATAAQTALSDLLTRYVGAFNSTPTYVGSPAPWSVGALYWNKLQGKFFVWSGSTWTATDATAQQAKIDAEAAASSAAQIAVGLSYDEYTLDGVSALDQGAVISFPKGLFVLNGNRVSLDTLLAASTAQKRILGPDGNYLTSDANTIAQTWEGGLRAALIESVSMSSNSVNSEDLTADWTPERTNASVASNALFGSLALTTLTSLGNYQDSRNFGSISFSGDKSFAYTAAVMASAGVVPEFAIYDGTTATFGSLSTVKMRVLSGPGGFTLYPNGIATLDGLSATVPTVYEIVRTFTGSAASTAYAMFYANWTAVGQTIKIGRVQFEEGLAGSSYVPCGASPTARPPDVVTAASGLLALLTGANQAIVMRGKVLGGDGDGALFLSNRFYGSRIFNNGVDITLDGATSLVAYTPGNAALPTFGAAMTSGGGVRKAALTGGSVVSSVEPWLSASDTTIRFGDYTGGSHSANYLLDEIVVWPIFASDAGLQAQARVYS